MARQPFDYPIADDNHGNGDDVGIAPLATVHLDGWLS